MLAKGHQVLCVPLWDCCRTEEELHESGRRWHLLWPAAQRTRHKERDMEGRRERETETDKGRETDTDRDGSMETERGRDRAIGFVTRGLFTSVAT